MLRLALVFLVLAILAALLNLAPGVSDTLLWGAKVLFVVFIVLTIVSFLFGAFRGSPPAA